MTTQTASVSCNPLLPLLCHEHTKILFHLHGWHHSPTTLAVVVVTTRKALSHQKIIPSIIMTKKMIEDAATVVAVTGVRGGSIPKKWSPSHHEYDDYNKSPKHKLNHVPLQQKQQQLLSLWTLYNNLRTGTVLRPCTILVQHLLYWVTAADAVHSLFLNEYSGIYRWWYASTTLVERTSLVPSVYSKLFYFARLRPRLLYAIGALVRA
jgi:hypothetical protein